MKVVSQQRQIKKNKEIKVLLSFLDTGPLDPKENRTYRTTEYHLGETNLGKYPFVSSALKKHYQVDTLLLMGTVHSMWEEVYRWFSENSGKPIQELYSTLVGNGYKCAYNASDHN